MFKYEVFQNRLFLLAAIVIMGFTSITVPSIEKRFSLTSKELGVILASNDVTALIIVIFIGYYGDYWNKIRLIGGGGVFLSKFENSYFSFKI